MRPKSGEPVEAFAMRGPVLWALVAFLLTVLYAAYLQPDWEPRLDDQADYLQLARGVAARGEYTRALPNEAFLPEPHRRPGYPLFLAALCRTVGCDHWQIALAQAALLAATVLVTARIAREVLPSRAATATAALSALYLPLAYHAALALSETLAVFLAVAAVDLFLRARRTSAPAWALGCGAACGLLALTRPAFILLPLLFLALHLSPDASGKRGDRRSLALLLAAFVVLQAPFFAYTYASFGGPLASTSGTVLWSGYLQGKTRGDTASLDAFTQAAFDGVTGAALAARGAAIGLDAVESEEAAAAFRDVRAYETAPDRSARLAAFVTLNESLQARALRLIAHDPAGYVVRGFTARTVGLWAGDTPLRVADAAAMSPLARVALGAIELVAFLGGLIGAVLLARTRALAGMLVAGMVAYVWLVSLPFLTEGRYALPARPFLLIALVAAAVAWGRLAARRSRS